MICYCKPSENMVLHKISFAWRLNYTGRYSMYVYSLRALAKGYVGVFGMSLPVLQSFPTHCPIIGLTIFPALCSFTNLYHWILDWEAVQEYPLLIWLMFVILSFLYIENYCVNKFIIFLKILTLFSVLKCCFI